MNAIQFLISEHERVKKILSDMVDGSHDTTKKRKIFELVSKDLIRHELMEHQLWYPHFKNNHRLNSTLKNLLKEENHAEKAIKKIRRIKDDKLWERCIVTFKNEVEKHAKEEEEYLFPQVQKILTENELNNIGKEMYEYRKFY